jgi:hypothetical protein
MNRRTNDTSMLLIPPVEENEPTDKNQDNK